VVGRVTMPERLGRRQRATLGPYIPAADPSKPLYGLRSPIAGLSEFSSSAHHFGVFCEKRSGSASKINA